MRKTKKHLKKNRFNKTLKGGGDNESNDGDNKSNDDKSVGNILVDAAKSGAEKVYGVVKDATLNAAGLEEKNKTDENDKEKDKKEEEDKPSLISRAAATVLEPVKDFVESALVKESVTEMAKDTVEAVKDNLKIFNEEANKPEVKEEIIEGINTASVYGDALIEASKEPINKALDEAADSINDAAPKFGKAVANTINATAEEVPVVGTVYAALNVVNNLSKAASAAVQTGSQVFEIASNAFTETKENYDKVMKELEEKKQLANKISERTTKSINEFTSPLDKFKNQTEQAAGKRKTKRRLIKRKVKSKRVRFAF